MMLSDSVNEIVNVVLKKKMIGIIMVVLVLVVLCENRAFALVGVKMVLMVVDLKAGESWNF